MIHDTQSTQISHKQDEHKIYVIMKIMCPPGYHHNGFLATHALGHMMYGSCAQVHELSQSHCGENGEPHNMRTHIYLYCSVNVYLKLNTSKLLKHTFKELLSLGVSEAGDNFYPL